MRMIWDRAWAHPRLGGRRLQAFTEGRDSMERVRASSSGPCFGGCGHIWGDIGCAQWLHVPELSDEVGGDGGFAGREGADHGGGGQAPGPEGGRGRAGDAAHQGHGHPHRGGEAADGAEGARGRDVGTENGRGVGEEVRGYNLAAASALLPTPFKLPSELSSLSFPCVSNSKWTFGPAGFLFQKPALLLVLSATFPCIPQSVYSISNTWGLFFLWMVDLHSLFLLLTPPYLLIPYSSA